MDLAANRVYIPYTVLHSLIHKRGVGATPRHAPLARYREENALGWLARMNWLLAVHERHTLQGASQ